MTLPNAVTALITARRLEQVPADLPSARARLSRAEDKPGGRAHDRHHRHRDRALVDPRRHRHHNPCAAATPASRGQRRSQAPDDTAH